jgi:hypothetical protein
MSAGPTREVVRAPAELVPLIQRELAQCAAHYRAAGQLLLEAKRSLPHGRFKFWVRDHLDVSYRQASRYTRMSATRGTFDSFRDLEANPTTQRKVHPHEMDRIRKRHDEADQMREEAYQLVTAGYRVRALKLHPDRPGGSVEAMARLNKVRARLLDHWVFQ